MIHMKVTSEPVFFENGIDSHFHLLEMQRKGLAVDDALARCADAHMSYLLDIGLEADDLLPRCRLPEAQPYLAADAPLRLLFAAGIFPSAVTDFPSAAQINRLTATLLTTIQASPQKPVAIGEIGIERHYPCGEIAHQEYLMEAQIEIANELNLPVCIHNREADSVLFPLLKRTPPKAGGWIHCFSSTPEAAERFLELGLSLSFCGNTTYPSSHSIHEALKVVPLHRLLTETDSPFLPPREMRGRPNTPLYTYYTARFIAEQKQCTLADLTSAVHRNFCRLLQLPSAANTQPPPETR